MDVVPHQAPSMYRYLDMPKMLVQQGQVDLIVSGSPKDNLSIGAPLGGMVGMPGKDASSISWHCEKTVTRARRNSHVIRHKTPKTTNTWERSVPFARKLNCSSQSVPVVEASLSRSSRNWNSNKR